MISEGTVLSTIRWSQSSLFIPPEVLRRIVTHASDQDLLATLCLVNSKTLEIAGPVLMRQVELRSTRSFERFFEPLWFSPLSTRVASALNLTHLHTLFLDFNPGPSTVGASDTVPSRLSGLSGPFRLKKLVFVVDSKSPELVAFLLSRVFIHLDPVLLHVYSSTRHESTKTLLLPDPSPGTFEQWISLRSVTLRGLLPFFGPSLGASRPFVRLLRPASSSPIELIVDIRVLSGLDLAGTQDSTKLLGLGREEGVETLRVTVGSDWERKIVTAEASKLEAGVRAKIRIRVQALRREFPWELVEYIMTHCSLETLAVFCRTGTKALQAAAKLMYRHVEIDSVELFHSFFYDPSIIPSRSRLSPLLSPSLIRTLHLNISCSSTFGLEGNFSTARFSPLLLRFALLPSTLALGHLHITLRPSSSPEVLIVYFTRVLPYLNPTRFTIDVVPRHENPPYVVHVPLSFARLEREWSLASWTGLESVLFQGVFPIVLFGGEDSSPLAVRSKALAASAGSRMRAIPRLKVTLDLRTSATGQQLVWPSALGRVFGPDELEAVGSELRASGMLRMEEVDQGGLVVLVQTDEEAKEVRDGVASGKVEVVVEPLM